MTEPFDQNPVEVTIEPPIRGDAITGERYYSRKWMAAEWENVFTKVWHVGGMLHDLEEPGDWICHNLAQESVLMIMQEDRTVKAFFNACIHRGNRLVWDELGTGEQIGRAHV